MIALNHKSINVFQVSYLLKALLQPLLVSDSSKNDTMIIINFIFLLPLKMNSNNPLKILFWNFNGIHNEPNELNVLMIIILNIDIFLIWETPIHPNTQIKHWNRLSILSTLSKRYNHMVHHHIVYKKSSLGHQNVFVFDNHFH